jgi:4-amino-4-deoxy-L-arabinose transferase-like glycosyltransferase
MLKLDKKLWIVIFLSVILFGANLSGISIYVLDEAKNSVAAREMLEGNLIVPTFNYELRTDKPPLHYYFMMVAYSLFGVNEFSARFFSFLLGVALVVGTFLFTRKFLDKHTAFWSSMVLLSSIQVIIQFHMAVPDPYLIFFFTVSLFCAYAFYTERKQFWLYLAYISISFAVLAKGPVALLLGGTAWILFLILIKDLTLETLRSFYLHHGLLIIACIVLPWYILVHVQTQGEWTRGFFLSHNLNRFTSTMEGHGGSFLLIPLYVIMGLFPFSLFLPPALKYCFIKRDREFLVLCGVAAFVVIAFFSLSSTKLPNYPAPAFAFVSILLGFYLSKKIKYKSVLVQTIFGIYFIITLVIPIAIYIVVEDVIKLPEIKHLAWVFMVLPVGSVLALSFYLRKRRKYALTAISGSWIIITLFFFYLFFPQLDKRNAVYQSLKTIKQTDQVYYHERYNPSYSFYLKRKISPLSDSVIQQPAVVLSWQKNLSNLDPLQDKFKIIQTHKEFFEPYFSIILIPDTK